MFLAELAMRIGKVFFRDTRLSFGEPCFCFEEHSFLNILVAKQSSCHHLTFIASWLFSLLKIVPWKWRFWPWLIFHWLIFRRSWKRSGTSPASSSPTSPPISATISTTASTTTTPSERPWCCHSFFYRIALTGLDWWHHKLTKLNQLVQKIVLNKNVIA